MRTRHVHLRENMERIAHHRGESNDSNPTEQYICELAKPWHGLRGVALVRLEWRMWRSME